MGRIDFMNITGILSSFVANASYADLPEAAVLGAKRGLLDFIAVTLAGSREEAGDKIRAFARQSACCDEATVLNGGYRTSAAMAALANGTMSHALDYDDVIHVLPYWLGHPSVAIVPAVLALAEKMDLSGQDVILGYCIGIEVYVKTALYCGDGPYRNGWHNTSYIGSLAAAAACAKLLKLSETQIRNAFGMAASMACGIRQNFGTMTKPLHAGLAARNGVEAALLAAADFTANEGIYEAPLGFRNVFTAQHRDNTDIPFGEETLTPEEFASRLGNPWNMASPGMSVKLCPSCRGTHFGNEAALRFREKFDVPAEQIAEIECRVPNHLESVLIYHDPVEGLQGKFSLEYVLARTILDGTPGLHDFTDEKVNEPAIKELTRKIKWVSFVPEAGSFGIPEYIFRLTDGREFRVSVEFPRGEPENPVTDEILARKYRDCAREALEPDTVEQVRELVMTMEQQETVAPLLRLLGHFPA